jgi:leader peptidase (prepilin peptidase)/N-methyltransferase
MNIPYWIWPIAVSPFIGSFLGAIVKRIEQPHSIVLGRSSCESCHATLGPLDLVPIVSWLALRGRCRRCGATIGLFYPLIELAAVFIAIWVVSVMDGELVWASCILGWTLLALAVIDWKHFLLPDFLTLPLIPFGLFVIWLSEPSVLPHYLAGAVAGFVLMVLLRALYRRLRGREGMGLGDAKLLAAAGAFVAWEGLPSVILISSFAALVAALIQSVRKGGLSLTDPMPFGTFLCFGTWIVWLYGPLTFG